MSGKITIFNKRRDNFQLKVGKGLTISNIVFNSLDSILFPDKDGAKCLSKKEACCTENNGVISSTYSSSPCLNDTHLWVEMTQYCTVAEGISFINFDITNFTMLYEPPKLTLDAVEFRYFLQKFNSFIRPNEVASIIDIKDSTFSHFAGCGAIIRNKEKVVVP